MGGLNCDYCNEVFNSDYRAKNHYKSKHPGKPIIAKDHEKHHCNLCTEFFLTKDSLNCHLNLDHGMKTEKNFCRDCKQPYTNEHTSCPRNYKNPNPVKKEKIICPQCNKSYSSKQYLREHIGTAQKEKDTLALSVINTTQPWSI